MRIVSLGLLLVLSLSTRASGYDLMPSRHASGESPRIEVLTADGQGVSLTFDLPELITKEVSHEGAEFQDISITGGGARGAAGQPILPTFSRLIAVPDGMAVRVRTEPLVAEDLHGVRLLPEAVSKRDQFAADRAARTRAPSLDDAAMVEVGEPAYLRDVRVVPLTFQPVAYDAEHQTLRVTSRMQVDVEFVPAATQAEQPARRHLVPASFDRLYRETVLNYEGEARAQIQTPGTYLLICPNSSTITTSLQPLIDWRERQGTPVILATTAQTGTSRTAIKSYIQGVYDDPAVALEFVTLVGDAGGSYSIPAWTESASGYNGEGDLPYSQLQGNDALPDVHIGRLSIDSAATLDHIVSKIVGYESSPELTDPGWYARSCLTGDPGNSGMSCVFSSEWTADRLAEIGYAEADTIFTGSFTTKMRNALNRGDSIFTYRGWWGMSGWSNAYTNLLTNAWKMPFSVIITCDTGSFASGTAISEGFLRSWDGTNSRPRGAIGAVGMATTGTHTRYNNCMYYGILRGLIQEGQHTMGAALTRGKLEMVLNYGHIEPNTVTVWNHWANLMGDPAVDVWTSYPEALDVSYPASVAVGTNAVTVIVTESSTPIADAKVCLSKDGETYVVGTTDAAGHIELPVTTTTPGDMLLTVTKHDKHPHLATIAVASHTSFVGYADLSIDDDALLESSGNDDGIVNPAETIELAVQLQNFGTQTESAIVATLTSTDPYVTIGDDAETFGTLGVGGTVWCTDDFDFTVDPSCPDGHLLALGIDVASAAGGPWHSRIELVASSAALHATTANVEDLENGRLDPGETVDITVELLNQGTASATNVTGTLTSLSSLVTIGDATGSFGTIAIDGSGENTADHFTVTASGSAYEGYVAAFELVTSFNDGTADSTEFQLNVGSRSTNDPVGPDLYGYLAYDDSDTDYADAPTYNWIEIDPAYGGDGTEIVLGDNGEYQDESRTLDLPFAFDYYGENYTQATVCSNGWIAMGATGSVLYRNWTIPGAGGPNAMIAPYWDNLYQAANSKAFHKYDAVNHWWIVEWSRFRNEYNNSTQTFQTIFYDPAHHGTDTGDGIIVFQYQQVSNPDTVNGNATVGIESPDQLDGLLYSYFSRYSNGAASLTAGRAIKFLPSSPGPTGTLAGNALNASHSDAPIEGVQIAVVEAARTIPSGADGSYTVHVPPGTYTVIASHPSFAPDSVAGVNVTEAQVTPLDFHLTDIAAPLISVSEHPWTDDTIGPYAIPVTIEEYSGLASRSLFYSTGGGSFSPVILQSQGGDDYLAEIPGQPDGTIVRYYVTATDGIGLAASAPEGAPASTFSFLVAQSHTILEDTFETAGNWSVGAADDDATTGVWLRADPVGSEFDGFAIQTENDHTPNPGTDCFVTGNAGVSDGAGANDVDNGKTTLFSPVFDLSGQLSAGVSYWLWFSNNRGSTGGEDPWIVEVTDDGSNWVTLENTLQSTNEAWVLRSFLLHDYISLTNQVQFRFVAADEGNGSLVEAAIDDFLLTGVTDTFTGVEFGPGVAVREHQLEAPQPNPFRGQTQITFALPNPGHVSLRVFDVAGRLVSTLVDGVMEPGRYRMNWDGRNDAGRRQASGVYFARYTAPGFSQVKRVTLLR